MKSTHLPDRFIRIFHTPDYGLQDGKEVIVFMEDAKVWRSVRVRLEGFQASLKAIKAPPLPLGLPYHPLIRHSLIRKAVLLTDKPPHTP